MSFVNYNSLIVLVILCSISTASECPCQNKADCEHIMSKETNYENNKEVYVFSDGSTSVETWNWNTITTLVTPENFKIDDNAQKNTMCTTHNKGKKFAITVPMTLSGQINVSNDEAISWIDSTVSKQQSWHADVVVIDLLPYFKSDVNSTEQDHMNLALIIKRVMSEIRNKSNYSAEIDCIIPWKPPCSDEDEECIFTTLSTDGCDRYIISPDSFTDVEGVKCRAKATLPLSKLLHGISEYASHHISPSRVILGIPWHGYDYKCNKLENEAVCIIGEANACQVIRKRLSHGDIYSDFRIYLEKAEYYDIYGAPYFNYKNGSENHQVWYEDRKSLVSKYRLVQELDLKGVAVMYGDDLSSHSHPMVLVDDEQAWSWLTHEILLEVSRSSRPDFHIADTIAAVAVSCLLVGTFLGSLFTCLALKRTVKKPREPFARDVGHTEDEFLDDPNL
ncbi:hypothetical protein Btru_071991 [Bulinus truncatus]|nr:hypothetical protein Btru_071991 [Bulinus truncatus]